MSLLHRPIAVATVLMLATACHGESTAPGNAFMAGSWALVSVSGRGPASGSLILSVTGQAERRVRYAQTSGGAEYVARGTYRVRAGGVIELQLREDDGRSEYVWQPMAVLTEGAVEFRYPDPADGPDIVERYQRILPL